jgi:hypothetical protein
MTLAERPWAAATPLALLLFLVTLNRKGPPELAPGDSQNPSHT